MMRCPSHSLRLSIMPEQYQYSISPSRNIEGIQQSDKSDAQRMRAENAQARLKARKQAERDQQMRDAIAKLPAEHRV